MKRKTILSLLLVIAIVVTQFSLLGGVMTVSASALSGRSDFLLGVNIHPVGNYAAYNDKTYTAIHDAKDLGSNVIRIDGTPSTSADYNYYKAVGDLAAAKGMEVMLVDTSMINRLKSSGDFVSVGSLDTSAITTYYTELATQLAGKVKYYQIGNEMDNDFYKGSASDHGATYSTTKYYDVTVAAVAINTAVQAIHTADPTAKVVINFNYFHRGFIHGLKSVDCDPNTSGTQTVSWDYIGMDFYSNMIDGSNTYTSNISSLASYSEPIIVTEANITATGWDSGDHDNITYTQNAAWLGSFLSYCYNNSDVAGFIAYELYDEPAYAETEFHREAFFGLIDKNGNKKATYTTLQDLYGGSATTRPSIPDAPDRQNVGEVVDDYLYKGKVESVVQSLATDTMFYITGIPGINLTKDFADYTWKGLFEFDIYVEDVETFKTVANAQGLTFHIQFYSGSAYREASNIPLDKIKKDGWNHVVLAVSNFYYGSDAGFTSVDRMTVNFNIADSSLQRKLAISGMKIGIANVCGTKLTKETESAVGTKIDTQFPTRTSSNIYRDTSNTNNVKNYPVARMQLATLDLSSYWHEITSQYQTQRLFMEFDFWVDDLAAMKKEATEHGVTYNFFLSSNNTSSANGLENNYLKYDLLKHLYKDGWNHIVLEFYYDDLTETDVARPKQRSSFSESAVRDYGIMIWDNRVCPDLRYYTYMMTNLIFTQYAVPTNTALGIVESSLTTNTDGMIKRIVNKAAGNGSYDSTGMIFKKTPNDIDCDFSTAENVEFDVFVENFGLWNKEVKANNLDLALKLNSNSTYSDSTTCMSYSFWDQITSEGWNHITAPVSEWSQTATPADLSSISTYKLTFTGPSGTNGYGLWYDTLSPYGLLGIYNIHATKAVTAPGTYATVMNDVVDGLKKVTLDGDGFFNDSVSIDASSDRMLELDIRNFDGLSSLTVTLIDSSDGYAEYTFTSLGTNEWKHFTVRLSDLTKEDFHPANIVGYEISGTAGKQVYIANLYTANYIDGDGNRDGLVNIIDYVAAKKQAAGSGLPNYNIAAIDLYGDDYTIQAGDLTSIANILLTAS